MSHAPPPPRPPVNKWLVTVSITFGTLMGAIDASIVNVALPHIRGAVGASVQEITWISTGYALANVLVMPLTAFLGRLFGQKRVYMACLVLFLVGSALCGIAHSLVSLVLYRAIQGFGAGALQPTEQAILRQTFPPHEQGTAMALFGMAVMLGPAIGPSLGGYIVDNFSWEWIFYINLPVGLLGLFMVANFVHEDPALAQANRELAAKQRKKVDWLGIALMSMGLCCLQYFLEEGGRNDWFEDRNMAACFAAGIVCLVLFVVHELRAPAPVVNLTLFADPVFTSGTIIGALMFAMLMGGMFLLPIFMQELLGFTAMQSGMALIPRVLAMMVVTPIVGRLMGRVSPRLMVAVGAIFFCVGAYQMSQFNLALGAPDIVAAIVLQGIGFGCMFVPLTTVALSSIPRPKIPDATGLNSLIRQIGGSVGLAIFATLLERYATVAKASVAAHVTATRPEVTERLAHLARGFVAQGAVPQVADNLALGTLVGGVARQAMLLSFDRVFFLTGVCFLGILPLLYFLRSAPSTGPRQPILMEH